MYERHKTLSIWNVIYRTIPILCRSHVLTRKKSLPPSIGSDKIIMLLDIIGIPFFTAIGNNGLQKFYRNKILADRSTVVFYILIYFFALLFTCGLNIDENLFCGRLIEEKAAARNLDSDALTVAVSDYDSYIFLASSVRAQYTDTLFAIRCDSLSSKTNAGLILSAILAASTFLGNSYARLLYQTP